MEAKKLVLKLQICCEKEKKKALKKISGIPGIDLIAMDMKDRKLTVIGVVDPVEVVRKLRKCWHTDVITLGPSKEPEKKPNKDDGNKPEAPHFLNYPHYYYYVHPYYTHNY